MDSLDYLIIPLVFIFCVLSVLLLLKIDVNSENSWNYKITLLITAGWGTQKKLAKKISLNTRLKKSSKIVENKVLPYQISILYEHLFNELIFGGKKSDTK